MIRTSFILLLSVIPIIFANKTYANEANQTATDFNEYGGFFSNGFLFAKDDISGLGFSLGGYLKRQRRVLYTLKYTFYHDFSYVIGIQERDYLDELALLYGRKWKGIWLSAGAGVVDSSEYNSLAEIRTDYKEIGLAYSVLWISSLKWLDLEISGNLNQENSYSYFSLGIRF